MPSILGLNAFRGDAAVALVVDVEVVTPVEEERFNRVKHAVGSPSRAAGWCLEAGTMDRLALGNLVVCRSG